MTETAPFGTRPAGELDRADALRLALERLERLHAVTAALAGAMTPEQVARAVTQQGIAALGAAAGSIALVAADGEAVELLASEGYEAELVEAFRRLPLGACQPLAEVARTGEPIFLRDGSERAARYPHLARARSLNGAGAMACVPLSVEGPVRGVLGFNFREPRAFDADERGFLVTLARQCAQALERARLYEEERRQREALHESESRFRSLVLASANMVWRADREGRVEDVPAWRELTGQPSEAAREDGWLEAVHVADRAAVGAAWRAAVASATVFTAECRVRSAEGSYRHFAARAVPIRASDGSVAEWVGTWTDITERKEAEQALRRSEERFRSLSASSPIGIFVANDFGLCTYTNPSAEAISGFKSREALGMGWTAFLHPEDRTRVVDAWTRYAGRGGSYSDIVRWLHADGSVRWSHLRAAPIVSERGERMGHVGTIEDITVRKRAEEGLRRLASIVQHTADAIVSVTPSGTLTDWNPGAERMFGYTAAEMIGEPISRIMPDDRPEEVELVRRAARGEPVAPFETERVAKDGTRRHVSILLASLRDEAGAVVGVSAIVRDVTEARRALRELDEARLQVARSEKLSSLGGLVAGVAHELRTPLAYATNNLYLVRERIRRAAVPGAPPLSHEELLAFSDEALAGMDRINGLVKSLRKFTTMEHGTRVRADLVDTVREAVDLFGATQRGRVAIATRFETLPPVSVDRAQIQQVVINLLENAGESMPTGAHVLVTVRNAEGGAEVVVRDNGPGISKEVQGLMWEAFFTTKPDGTGLGLAIVRRIVETHGGRIRCDSEPGKGAAFTVWLPAGPPQAAKLDDASPTLQSSLVP